MGVIDFVWRSRVHSERVLNNSNARGPFGFYTSYNPGAIRTLGDGKSDPPTRSSPGIASVLRMLGSQIGFKSWLPVSFPSRDIIGVPSGEVGLRLTKETSVGIPTFS